MSVSMWIWRIIFPCGGLIVALGVLAWAAGPSIDGQGGRADAGGVVSAAKARENAPARVVADGRVVSRPGAEVTVGTALGGLVVEVRAREKAWVRKGEFLVRLRSADQDAAVAEAEGRLAEADAELGFQKREVTRRAKAAIDTRQFSAEVEAGRRDFEIATARRKTAAAVLDQARSAQAQTRIEAPIDGVILACLIQPGETAEPGARLVTVCDLTRTRVEAEVDEFDAQRVALGSDVLITAEGHGTTVWRGTVEEIPDSVSNRSIRPDDPGRPTDTGVLLVKIAPASPIPLKLGQQVSVEIMPHPADLPDGGAEAK